MQRNNTNFQSRGSEMNKTTVALTVEQYKEIIKTMRNGFTGCWPLFVRQDTVGVSPAALKYPGFSGFVQSGSS